MKEKPPLWMILCCAAPVGLGLGLYFAGWISGLWVFLLIMLACPVLHLLMMRGHGHG
ncbi:MAG: DUF2933 domain-containing protein [Nitrospinota bacterium]